MKTSDSIKKLTPFLALTAVTVCFFLFFSPTELPLLGLVVPYILVFLLVYSGVRLITRVVHIRRLGNLTALVAAAFSVMILLLGSLHQLSFRDIALSVAIVFVLGWYISKLQQ